MSNTVEISIKSFNELMTTLLNISNENKHVHRVLSMYKQHNASRHKIMCKDYESYFSKKDHDTMDKLLRID
jgi:hypothetical protein